MKRAMRMQLFLLDNLIWVLLAAFFLFNAVFTDSFLKPENLVNIFRAVAQQQVVDDGLQFDGDSVAIEPITDEAQYQGLRVKLGDLAVAIDPESKLVHHGSSTTLSRPGSRA